MCGKSIKCIAINQRTICINIQMFLKRKLRCISICHHLWLVWMKAAFPQPLLCNQLLQVDQNQNGQQVGLKVSSHERFKHTFYPAPANQDSYANSISDCLARDSFGNKISKERQSKTNMDRKINFWFVWFYLDKITGWWTYRICMIWCFKSLFFWEMGHRKRWNKHMNGWILGQSCS